jgi:hypothetical protein
MRSITKRIEKRGERIVVNELKERIKYTCGWNFAGAKNPL